MGGGAPKPVKKVTRAVTRPVKKIVKGVKKAADEVFEEVIEKPVKKVGKETFDVVMGTTDEERRAMLYGETPDTTPEVTPEVTAEVVPDDETILGRGRRRTKGKRSGAAGTLMEEYGVAYAGPSPKAPTGTGSA